MLWVYAQKLTLCGRFFAALSQADSEIPAAAAHGSSATGAAPAQDGPRAAGKEGMLPVYLVAPMCGVLVWIGLWGWWGYLFLQGTEGQW